MRSLHVGLRVSDLQRPLVFYQAVGYTVTGTVDGTAHGTLSMLSCRTNPDGYRIEFVQWPARHPDGITKADFA
jgi:lactoylglutathione lyase